MEKSFEFLKQELPTRWMQIFAEINALPIEKPSPLMLEVKSMIQETLENLLPFTDQPATENVISKVNEISFLCSIFFIFSVQQQA